jgi:hypothetical protein
MVNNLKYMPFGKVVNALVKYLLQLAWLFYFTWRIFCGGKYLYQARFEKYIIMFNFNYLWLYCLPALRGGYFFNMESR